MLSQFDPMTFTIMVSGWVTAIVILLVLLIQITKTKQALQSSVHEKELRLEQAKLYADTRDYLTSVLPGKTLELMESKAKVSQEQQIQLVQHQLTPILRELSQLGNELHNRQKEEAFF
jgi:uncharacterized membrane protein YraQ (UPF0718 family)